LYHGLSYEPDKDLEQAKQKRKTVHESNEEGGERRRLKDAVGPNGWKHKEGKEKEAR
jgi:hypothetical protein